MVTQQVLVTGPFGEAGEAILNHLAERDEYEFTYLDRTEHPEYETFVADIADYEAIRPAFDGQDAVIHLAAQSDAGAAFEDIVEPNIMGTYNVLKAMEDAGVEKLIYASSQRVMGLYEEDLAPDLYGEDYPSKYDPFRLSHETLPKPDGYYGASKMFGEHICRTHARRDGAPSQVYSIRISSVRTERYDHPYGDAERGVDRGDEHKVEDGEVWDQSQTGSWERGSDEYEEMVKRLKATWTSQRDFAHLLECCLEDDSVTYDTFYAVSGNKARWFDIDHAKAVLDYEPADDGSEWDSPPE
ncbi:MULTISPECIES: NAD(P)-dependent oxidoreductase [unclassified Haloferax]|uniref:NAD-dependent epimerase/dehydratase family protein n=1 Tax=Haloferax TaxID=2251 RepID=UPI0002B115CA|nr:MULTISPECIES: NAD(P)-dependent oxidoreductase [unclassified Haloferax]ELZ58444.1 sugar epimerase/dehydratase-like protein [Haloferax sp. ATCC BAA-646]ELZ63124.1 sugar epimerase/dehydratase-like protein [Haloferax sp. ATCC BAA-644]ELZ63248.1 sugar epimerase/dehydratase-like protein [Haloferax sp. ATCC BAA-645]